MQGGAEHPTLQVSATAAADQRYGRISWKPYRDEPPLDILLARAPELRLDYSDAAAQSIRFGFDPVGEHSAVRNVWRAREAGSKAELWTRTASGGAEVRVPEGHYLLDARQVCDVYADQVVVRLQLILRDDKNDAYVRVDVPARQP